MYSFFPYEFTFFVSCLCFPPFLIDGVASAATEKPSYQNLKPVNDKSRCKPPQSITNGANVDVSASVGMDESPSEVGVDSNNQGDFNSADNKPACEFPVQDIEGTEGLDGNAADGIDKQFSEADLEVNLVDNEVSVNNLEITAIEDNLEESKQSTVKRKLQIQGKWKGVDPVVLFKDETVIDSIKTFYGINEAFPLFGHLVTRNTDTNHVKRIYYVSKSVKDVLEMNFSVGQQLKITSIGLKMFVSILYQPFHFFIIFWDHYCFQTDGTHQQLINFLTPRLAKWPNRFHNKLV